ncbi:hypothetical protein S7335_601 [Synechococcus sp. PCC 7335]|uniref:DUF6544 family protein n=1 Tax=Synechococcus sp. (strain ATCC 29403 / PCC 7335) TaxID=91464 RepID=UPI00017ED9E6|nr:DUF6544 family protein [Synechococcus sp. PCC 7335]EDX83421.1 hypothetical protein S7335_601 [Synechococcus sp. PCC 7335]
MPSSKISLNKLWQSVPTTSRNFQPQPLTSLPEPVRRYLSHAISFEGAADTSKTQLAAAVRLKMHGEIKLKGWHPFRAEQVICAGQGMIWQATAWMNGLPVSGWDRLIEGEGALQWKLLGLWPVMRAEGEDITRSVIGRMQGEYAWLPSAFLNRAVKWTALDNTHVCAELTLLAETTRLHLKISESGSLQAAYFQRWGDPEGQAPHYENFGIVVEEEGTFSGYTIPRRLRAGWFFDGSSLGKGPGQRFESEGEFFRATIDKATYR